MKKIFFAFLIFMVTSICYAEVPELVIQNGHTEPVKSVDFSPDGKYLASGSGDEMIKIWEVATGKLIRNLEGHTNWVISVEFSPNGKYLASGSYDETIKIWRVSDWKCIKTLHAGTQVISVNFSPDGKYLTSNGHKTTKLWEVETGKLVRTFEGSALTFSPNGKNLVFHSGKFWEITKGKFVKNISPKCFNKLINLISYSKDGKYIAAQIKDKTVKLIDVEKRKFTRTLEDYSDHPISGKFSPDCKYFALGSWQDKTIRLWEVSTGKLVRSFEGHSESAEIPSSRVDLVKFSPDGKYLVSRCWFQRRFIHDGQRFIEPTGKHIIRSWEVETGERAGSFTLIGGEVYSVDFSPDGKYFVMGCENNQIYLLETGSSCIVRKFEGHSESVRTIGYSPDGKYLASGSGDKKIRIWETQTGKLIRTLEGHSRFISSVVFSPDGKYIASGSRDRLTGASKGAMMLWEADTGKLVKTLEGDNVGVISVAFNDDGKYLVSGHSDNIIRLWEVETGKIIKRIEGHKKINSVVFSPDSEYLASVDWNGKIGLWETETGKLLETLAFKEDSGGIIVEFASDFVSLAFSPDGRYVTSGNLSDEKIRLWEVVTGKLVKTLEGHSQDISSVAFSPDGKYLASCSYDKTTKIWEVETGQLLKTLKGHAGRVYSVDFSPDGKYLASGSKDTTIKLWDVKTGKLLVTMLATKEGEWITYTPEGYYDCSPGGNKYVSWRVGNKVYSFGQYEDIYHSPEIIKKQLKLTKAKAKKYDFGSMLGKVYEGKYLLMEINDIIENTNEIIKFRVYFFPKMKVFLRTDSFTVEGGKGNIDINLPHPSYGDLVIVGPSHPKAKFLGFLTLNKSNGPLYYVVHDPKKKFLYDNGIFKESDRTSKVDMGTYDEICVLVPEK